ncbi:TPA: hypothetical protein ACPWIL_006133 [Pseudomonas aeruginosa]|uniref:hypothetical protein n=1 Tax=Pseudomonas aeruginosa TaxID=287 RepID=UPI000691BEBD|nr:hypothetical protein [Pseudomonas aeruginosa]EIU5460356.1 hypothetical protein [Pseudomonas aeruginosa]EKY0500343.1 hypothetical protein [Pseudomonas aeruginosa]MBH9149140.1 hypothetical protein [Pseudomonas aeruginosa]MDI3585881.1 hypothetical protein [Pseudomonas aeruginosa]MDI3811482.1 hypothetical protein [Pseudomonas aeruginosa]
MARRRSDNRLDSALDKWAIWCAQGGALLGSGRSMLARLIDNKGEMFFGCGGGSSEPADSLESKIEMAVVSMYVVDPLRADVLRLEYDAAFWHVAHRRGITGYDPQGLTQFDKSLALGVSLRTYRGRLAEARKIIESLIFKER